MTWPCSVNLYGPPLENMHVHDHDDSDNENEDLKMHRGIVVSQLPAPNHLPTHWGHFATQKLQKLYYIPIFSPIFS